MRLSGKAASVAALVAALAGAAAVRWEERPAATRRPGEPVAIDAPGPPHFTRFFAVRRTLKGNLHTHTTRSDGDTRPEEVVDWYREKARGYAFLALTDHNVFSSADDSASAYAFDFTLLAGEEVTMWAHGLQVHANALCTSALIPGGTFPTAKEALAHAVSAIREQGGVALVNHPNFDWALTSADVVAAAANGAALLEIASGHPYVHSNGDATHPSHEQLWDDALSAGYDVMGVGVDDMHYVVTDRDPEAFPGRAWVQVFANEARPEVLCDALRRGELYASTGPTLRAIDVSGLAYTVDPADADRDAKVVFVGKGGRVLAEVTHLPATYTATGDEGYVRARVETPRGTAWTPAVRLAR